MTNRIISVIASNSFGWPFGVDKAEAVVAAAFPESAAFAADLVTTARRRRQLRQRACRAPEHATETGSRCPACGAKFGAVLGADARLRIAMIRDAFAVEARRRELEPLSYQDFVPVEEERLRPHRLHGGRAGHAGVGGMLLRSMSIDTQAFEEAISLLSRRGLLVIGNVDFVDVAPSRRGADGARVWSA